MPRTSRAPWIAAAVLALTSAAAAQAADPPLPEGKRKEAVQAHCTQCHGLEHLSRTGYGLGGWRNNLQMMINVGSTLPKDQLEPVARYLAANFPEKPKPDAAVIPGPVKASIVEWSLPTPGSRPHDPLAGSDGAIWYTGQFANVIGRVDPATGKVKEFALPAGSGPHGLVADKAGNIWYTANFKAEIGKLDPRTGKVTEYPMPDPAAKDPHTLVFDRSGTIWFTVQGANMVGRLDPASGEVKLVRSPTAKSRPYGIQVSSKGIPFFVEFGTNKVASIDPKTMEIREYPLPDAEARPRRLALTSDDALWYTDFARGYLGRLDPATGEVKEWRSPSGERSQPYGIASIKDVIWYNESNTKPNTIVRFDPRTERFQTWTIPSGGGVVRNVDVTRDGDLAIACSGVNKVGLVKIEPRTAARARAATGR
jgi:virginiamycin B lyase